MNKQQRAKEKDFTVSLIKIFNHVGSAAPTASEVRVKAEGLAKLYEYSGSLDNIVGKALTAVTTKMGAGASLVSTRISHEADWVHQRQDIQWTYNQAYEALLSEAGWSHQLWQSLSDVSLKILGYLQDPTKTGAWDRRGLVIGQVQSGKTSNYLSLIARAADAGYKFIVVIAGIVNVLRTQTQQRVDEGFVGRNSETKEVIGVGKSAGYPYPVTLTTVHDDFNWQTAMQSGWELNDLSKPIILVIKKNVSTLRTLYHWLRDMNARGEDHIENAPMLMIDDEADHASINTNKPDQDPTKTNRWIRDILKLFAKSGYVGYTATPFANIFINPESYDKEVLAELFPRDFIHCLDAPSNYFGPDKVFLEEEGQDPCTVSIEDCEDVLPLKHKKDFKLTVLPESLCRAINEFVVARAIRNFRGQTFDHCSMMINVSRFRLVQRHVRDLVSVYLRQLQEAVQANYAMPAFAALADPYMQALKHARDEAYPHCGASWTQIRAQLQEAVSRVRLFLINSDSEERLDYKRYEQDGSGLTAIAVGGLSLSRGLTLEGLCVSYVYRNSRMYDTLMQMGRWFGYRNGYEDLCRIYLSADAISWYSFIADASHDLVANVKEMQRQSRSPEEFGLYVRTHPDRLLITAPSKMISGQKIALRYNYAGTMREFHIVPLDDAVNAANERLIESFWGSEPRKLEPARRPSGKDSKGWIVRSAPTELVREFLSRFHTHHALEHHKHGVLQYLADHAEQYKVCDVVLVSPKPESSDPFRLGIQRRAAGKVQENDEKWILNKHRIASRGDEGLGLSAEQVDEAKAVAHARNGKEIPMDRDYRKVRSRPLLMVHVLSGKVNDKQLANARIPAIGISFPPGDYMSHVEVVANPVYLRQWRNAAGAFEERPAEEGDD